ncbi:MAG: class I SAM-dependent methyltransferase [Halanaeroarchaeum sp.]
MANPVLGDPPRVSRFYRLVAGVYDRLRPLYAGFAPTREQYFSALSLEDDDRVLDVGCGTGASTRRVVGADRSVHGVDLSPAQLAYARTKPAVADVSFALGDATHLPYRDDAFDVVLSVGSLPYVPDVRTALAEAHRVMVPDGRLLLVGPKTPDRVLARRVADAVLRTFDPDSIASTCRSVGFTDVEMRTVHMDWLGRDALVVTARA